MNAPSIAMQAFPADAGTAPVTKEHSTQIEAIRYAILRKLAPGLRHALMGELQAIQLSAELSARMLRANADITKIRETVGHLPDQCNAAVKTCRAVIEWLRPEDELSVAAGTGLKQCLKLAGDDWFLRGIEVVAGPPELDALVPKAAMQELVVTTLLVLTDLHDTPLDLRVGALLLGDQVEVTMSASASDRVASFPPMSAYRKLTWSDLELIANEHGIVHKVENERVTLRFPRAGPAVSGLI